MHPYSVSDPDNVDERTNTSYRLAIGSGLIGSLISLGIGYLSSWGIIATVAGPSSTLAIFLFLMGVLNNYCWRWPIIRVLLGISTPDLNGSWKGTVFLSEKGNSKKENNSGKMIIKQTWKNIGIHFETDISKSDSIAASIKLVSGCIDVYYYYHVKKRRPEIEDTFPNEDGAAVLHILFSNGEVQIEDFETTFFTEEGTIGTIILNRINNIS